jgi:hypothetical protein
MPLGGHPANFKLFHNCQLAAMVTVLCVVDQNVQQLFRTFFNDSLECKHCPVETHSMVPWCLQVHGGI